MARNFVWADATTWPHDAPNQIFFARAVDRIGRNIFDDWSASDPLAKPFTASNNLLPSFLVGAQRHHRDLAWRLIEGRYPERPKPDAVVGSSTLRPVLNLSDEDWELARKIQAENIAERRKAWEPATAAYNRYVRVKEFIRENCACGKLLAFVQHPDGSFSDKPLSDYLWNTDRFEDWFRSGKLSAIDAFGGWNVDATPKFWLFFSQETLESLVSAPDDQASGTVKKKRRTGQRGLIEDWLRDRHNGMPPANMTDGQRIADLHEYAKNVAKSPLRPDPKTLRKTLREIAGR